MLVGGSTVGILAAVRAMTRPGDRIIIARNCHRSVYNAAALRCLETTYLLPITDSDNGHCGSITPEQVTQALDTFPDAMLVVNNFTYI